MQKFEDIKITTTRGRGFYDITADIKKIVGNSAIDNGLFTAYIKHTSASLLINENYDPDVLVDMETFFSKLVPDGSSDFIHTMEGADDMPVHIRTALTQTHLSIPIKNSVLQIGQWQGIFLYEHRFSAHNRSIATHIIGE